MAAETLVVLQANYCLDLSAVNATSYWYQVPGTGKSYRGHTSNMPPPPGSTYTFTPHTGTVVDPTKHVRESPSLVKH